MRLASLVAGLHNNWNAFADIKVPKADIMEITEVGEAEEGEKKERLPRWSPGDYVTVPGSGSSGNSGEDKHTHMHTHTHTHTTPQNKLANKSSL